MKKNLFTLALLLVVGATISVNAGDTVKIGLSAPLTGDWAEYGNDFKQSVTMVFDAVNKAGGVHGK